MHASRDLRTYFTFDSIEQFDELQSLFTTYLISRIIEESDEETLKNVDFLNNKTSRDFVRNVQNQIPDFDIRYEKYFDEFLKKINGTI